MEKQQYSNVYPLGVNYKISKFNSSEEAFTQVFLPKYTGLDSLRNGREIKTIQLRPREILGLYLMCLVARYYHENEWTIGFDDPWGHDGLVIPKVVPQKGQKRGLVIEQVYVQDKEKPFVYAFEEALRLKSLKGLNYSDKLNLVVLSEYGDKEDLSAVIAIAQKSDFESCYLFILKQPVPCLFYGATLKSPSDPLEYYHLGINLVDGSGKIVKRGDFKPIITDKST